MKANIFVLIAAIFLLSCQKDDSIAGNRPTGAGKLISKHTQTLWEMTFTEKFSYDQQNRCTKMEMIVIDSSRPGASPTSDFLHFHYNGNDNLPYKITDASGDMNWYVFYDSQKRVVKDSTVGPADKLSITRYSYSGNMVIANTLSTTSFGIERIAADTLESDGSNYTRRSLYEPLGTHAMQFKSTYDNKPGAFSNLNIAQVFQYGITWLGGYYPGSKNNPITYSYKSSSGPDEMFYIITYVYDSDGFPVSAERRIAGATDKEIETFEY